VPLHLHRIPTIRADAAALVPDDGDLKPGIKMVRDQHLSHDRTQAETACAASRQRLDSIVSSAMDGIIDADVTSWWSTPAAEKNFGYTAAELLDQPVEILMPENFRCRSRALVVAWNVW
jgi:PAS domain-containing protein